MFMVTSIFYSEKASDAQRVESNTERPTACFQNHDYARTARVLSWRVRVIIIHDPGAQRLATLAWGGGIYSRKHSPSSLDDYNSEGGCRVFAGQAESHIGDTSH